MEAGLRRVWREAKARHDFEKRMRDRGIPGYGEVPQMPLGPRFPEMRPGNWIWGYRPVVAREMPKWEDMIEGPW
jgi:hypothetical protein